MYFFNSLYLKYLYKHLYRIKKSSCIKFFNAKEFKIFDAKLFNSFFYLNFFYS